MTNALQSPGLTYEEYLEHYGVPGMKWGVRKNRTGHVKSVVRRTPLRGSDESQKDPIVKKASGVEGGASSFKRTKKAYSKSRESIKQGLREINKSEQYKGKDLTDPKNPLTKEYHKTVSGMVTEKVNANLVLAKKKKDRYIPKMEYDLSKSETPKLKGLTEYEGRVSSSDKRDAKRARDSDMNVMDYAGRYGKEIAKRRLQLYGLQIVGGSLWGLHQGLEARAEYESAMESFQTMNDERVRSGRAPMSARDTRSPEQRAEGMVRSKENLDRWRSEGRNTEIFREDITIEDLERRAAERYKTRISHADDSDEIEEYTVYYSVSMSDQGHVLDVNFEVEDTPLEHSYISEPGSDYEAYLIHYGVKGMQWGKRKDRTSTSDSKAVKSLVKENRPDKKSSEDFVKDIVTIRSRPVKALIGMGVESYGNASLKRSAKRLNKSSDTVMKKLSDPTTVDRPIKELEDALYDHSRNGLRFKAAVDRARTTTYVGALLKSKPSDQTVLDQLSENHRDKLMPAIDRQIEAKTKTKSTSLFPLSDPHGNTPVLVEQMLNYAGKYPDDPKRGVRDKHLRRALRMSEQEVDMEKTIADLQYEAYIAHQMEGLDEEYENYLEHYGVPGMRWGERKKSSDIEEVKTGGGGGGNTDEEDQKILDRVNEALKQGGSSSEIRALLEESNAAKKRMEERARANGNARDLRSKEQREVDNQRSVKSDWGFRSDITIAELRERADKNRANRSVKHDDLFSVQMRDISPDYLAHYQADIDLDVYLIHYGVPGMKWGVRKDRSANRVSKATNSLTRRLRKSMDPDRRAAASVARSNRKIRKNQARRRELASKMEVVSDKQELKRKRQELRDMGKKEKSDSKESTNQNKSESKAQNESSKPKTDNSPQSMSKDDLQTAVNRMNLENQYARLMEERRPKSVGEKLTKVAGQIAGEVAKQQAKKAANYAIDRAVSQYMGNRDTSEKDKNGGILSNLKPKKDKKPETPKFDYPKNQYSNLASRPRVNSTPVYTKPSYTPMASGKTERKLRTVNFDVKKWSTSVSPTVAAGRHAGTRMDTITNQGALDYKQWMFDSTAPKSSPRTIFGGSAQAYKDLRKRMYG